MARFELERIEAPVVFVGVNVDYETVYVSPVWDCTQPREELQEQAVTFGLWCAEQDGGGIVRVEIHDFRNQA